MQGNAWSRPDPIQVFIVYRFDIDLSRIPEIKSSATSSNSCGDARWDDCSSDPPAGCCSWWEWAFWSIAGCS